jgi:hypothetical protein
VCRCGRIRSARGVPALISGLANDLAANTVCIRRPHGVYQVHEVGIAAGDFPAEPDRAVAIRVYEFTSNGQGDESVRVQVHVRGLPHDLASCEDIADAIRDRLSFLEAVNIGGYAGCAQRECLPKNGGVRS